MITSKKPSETGRAWPRWIVWTIAAAALMLLVLEHRAHALGWWLHALLGLCVVLLVLLVRADGAREDGPH